MSRDRIFSEPRRQIVDFAFDEAVAHVFPDMIRRSVPGYELVVPMTGLLAARHIKDRPAALVYDLGCSLGATSLAVLRALDALGTGTAVSIRAVDSSAAMLSQARTAIADPRIRFMEADARTMNLDACQVVTLNWVLQFLHPGERLGLLQRIGEALTPGGLLLLAEKVHAADPVAEAFNEAAHLDFKRANGYSELEISQKRTALEEVMITDTVDDHLARLREAGFSSTRLWYQCLNWAAFAATP